MMPRFQRILLPVDFTPKNESAIDVAKELAHQYDSTISLIHVIETINLPEDDELREFYAGLERRIRLQLAALAGQFEDAKAMVDQEVRFGHRAEEIVAFTNEQAIDLIVMSSHPVDPSSPVRSWNTLSYQVSLLCRCPILLVKSDQ
jgi:nucleotide-binding universal stress UspA family protein